MKTLRGIAMVSVAAAWAAMMMGCASQSPGLGGGSASKSPADAPAADLAPAATGADVGGSPAAQPAPPPPGALEESRGGAKASEDEVAQAEPKDRPGLGTEWGETRNSQIQTVPFVRADPQNPFVMASLFYNDEQGAQAMSGTSGFRRTSAGMISVGGGAMSIGLRDENGVFLNGFTTGGRNFAVGEAGRRYTIVIRNQTPGRFECVVSVDGLDVIDGRTASFGKRGYLVEPHGELEIDGFRQSTETVAAFRFGSVRESYASLKTGDSRNVGVIGFAIFHERGVNPFPWTNEELQKRRDANPFPGQFATPP